MDVKGRSSWKIWFQDEAKLRAKYMFYRNGLNGQSERCVLITVAGQSVSS